MKTFKEYLPEKASAFNWVKTETHDENMAKANHHFIKSMNHGDNGNEKLASKHGKLADHYKKKAWRKIRPKK